MWWAGVAMLPSCQNPRATSSMIAASLYRTFQCKWVVSDAFIITPFSKYRWPYPSLPQPHPTLICLFHYLQNESMEKQDEGLQWIGDRVDRQVEPKIEWVGYLNRTQGGRMHVHHHHHPATTPPTSFFLFFIHPTYPIPPHIQRLWWRSWAQRQSQQPIFWSHGTRSWPVWVCSDNTLGKLLMEIPPPFFFMAHSCHSFQSDTLQAECPCSSIWQYKQCARCLDPTTVERHGPGFGWQSTIVVWTTLSQVRDYL